MTTSRRVLVAAIGVLAALPAPARAQSPVPRPVVVTSVQETPTHVFVRFTVCNVKSGVEYGGSVTPGIAGLVILNGVAPGDFAAGAYNSNGQMMNPACPSGQEFNAGVQLTQAFSVVRKCGTNTNYVIRATAKQGSTNRTSPDKIFTAYSIGPCPPTPSQPPQPSQPPRPNLPKGPGGLR
jgi:hypothetical protein